ncbi:hypothetical protein F5X99DRAFT_216955 [Biscogniauxia marginata]|nr:hypothetical protein F5X99DRAFT_216955 [Biscogniauxia marginata]
MMSENLTEDWVKGYTDPALRRCYDLAQPPRIPMAMTHGTCRFARAHRLQRESYGSSRTGCLLIQVTVALVTTSLEMYRPTSVTHGQAVRGVRKGDSILVFHGAPSATDRSQEPFLSPESSPKPPPRAEWFLNQLYSYSYRPSRSCLKYGSYGNSQAALQVSSN